VQQAEVLPPFEQQAFAAASQLEHSFFLQAQDARKSAEAANRTVEKRIMSCCLGSVQRLRSRSRWNYLPE